MKQIWKAWLTSGPCVIQMPAGAMILHVASQQGIPCVWFLVDPVKPSVPRTFNTYGTGQNMPDDPGTYLGTLFTLDGTFVYHIYEED